MSKPQKPNRILQHERELRGWSQQKVAEEIGTDEKRIGVWERGESTPSPYFRQKLIELFGKNAEVLGFLGKAFDGDVQEESSQNDTYAKTNSHLSQFDLSVIDKLDSAESIINLAWEVWFASRPREAAHSVNKLLPGLERIAYSPYPPVYSLRAKELVIRAHGLLGSVSLDASLSTPTAI